MSVHSSPPSVTASRPPSVSANDRMLDIVAKLANEVDGLRSWYERAAQWQGAGNASGIGGKLLSVAQLVEALSSEAGVSLATPIEISGDRGCDNELVARERGNGSGPAFLDASFDEDEQLPRHFAVSFSEKKIGGHEYVATSINGVNVGDRLSDRIHVFPGSRYHDVFHFGHVAVLGWSPVVRNMIGRRRVSSPKFVELEDCHRAQVIEEAIVSHVFGYLREHDFLEGDQVIDPALIRTIQDLTRGYEVEVCSPAQWEAAIAVGCEIYRRLSANRGGEVVVDMHKQCLRFDCARPERHDAFIRSTLQGSPEHLPRVGIGDGALARMVTNAN